MLLIDSWTYLDLDLRLKLSKRPLALSLLNYLMCNDPNSLPNGIWKSVDEWQKAIGVSYTDRRAFVNNFKNRVLKRLFDIGIVTNYEHKNNSIIG